MTDSFLESFAYILPALVTGVVAYYMFQGFLHQLQNEKKIQLLAINKKELLPTKLKAYERMLLFCDRIHPSKLILRTPAVSLELNDYKNLLISTINQEFEHNLVQQLYVSDESWKAIVGFKTLMINQIRELSENVASINEFTEYILRKTSKTDEKTGIVIAILKKEIRKLL